MTESRGHFYDWHGNIKIFATFHPSYLLRNQSNAKGSPRWFASLDMTLVGFMYRAFIQGKSTEEVVKIIEEKVKSLEPSGGI